MFVVKTVTVVSILCLLAACSPTFAESGDLLATTKTEISESPENRDQRISELRQLLQEHHEEVMREYEEQDALYADMEMEEEVSQALSMRLSMMRTMYLQMQVQHGEMLEYHNRTDAHHKSAKQASRGLNNRDVKLDFHQYHQHLSHIADHHQDLVALHREMAALTDHVERSDLSERHRQLATKHGLVQDVYHEVMTLIVEAYDVDPTDEEMKDPIDDIPDDGEVPNKSRLL